MRTPDANGARRQHGVFFCALMEFNTLTGHTAAMTGDGLIAPLSLLCAILVPALLWHLNLQDEPIRKLQIFASAAFAPGTGNPAERRGGAAAPDWGDPVNGMSVRLHADKDVWALSAPIAFRVSVLNQGSETLSVAQTQQPGELEVDGVWYSWSHPYYVTQKPLVPSQQFDNIRVTPDAHWRSGLTSLVPGPGKHRFRFAVVAQRGEQNHGPVIRAVSNPVEVEFQWPARNTATTARATNAPAGSPTSLSSEVSFSGRVVDDETDQPITNFVLQFGELSHWEPEEISWTEGYASPSMTGPGHSANPEGRFGAQSYSTGKAWARILAEGYVPQPVTPEPVVSPVRVENLVVRLKRSGELRGIVLDHAGKPVMGARVYIAGTQRIDLTDGQPGSFGGFGGLNRSGWTFKGGTATTDVAGRFAVRGGNGTEQKVVVASADGLMVWVAPLAEAGQELKVMLPQPAVLVVRYDIPDDAPEAQLRFQFVTGELDETTWKDVTSVLEPKVANRGQIVLNVTPGQYELARTKMLNVGDGGHGVFLERRTVVVESGQTQRVDLVRSAGYSIQGEVVGLKDTDAPGAYIVVRSAEATGDPRQLSEGLLPSFDALTCGKDGIFHTARLAPGTYTIVVEAYGPVLPQFENIGGMQVQVWRSGIRLPTYVGTAKVTVGTDSPPTPVKIGLNPRPSTK